ncbi:MAG: hypothetical protein QOE77_3384 [Blastocatellia bacterium]|jgi:uncharacterized protein (DUF433 family)|nr:hypothetical protein [Blastocatellia bacterium]
MIDEKLLGRITANPEIFGGKPIIRGMRISVEMILSLLAQGEKEETILADYPDLEPDDLRACLAYAHAAISHDKEGGEREGRAHRRRSLYGEAVSECGAD